MVLLNRNECPEETILRPEICFDKLLCIFASVKFYFLYIDPSSGSYIIQTVIAAVLGSLFFVKTAWFKIKQFFKGSRHSDEKSDNKL